MNQTLSRRNLLALAATAAVARAAEPRVTVPAYNTLSDAEEIALGRKFAATMEREMPVLDVAPLESYVNSIVGSLARQCRRPNLRYTAKVVNTTDVNAVSLPGGFIYVFRGLLESVRNESELASVLSHEVGHVVARHSANQMMIDFRARQVYEMVKQNLELQNTVIEQIIAKFGGPLVILARLRYGREQELEADLLGMYNQIRSGWDPAGAVTFFRRMGMAREGGGDWMADALSTHPNPAERAQRIQAEINSVRLPNDLTTNTVSFQAMKLGLRLLPPAVRPKSKAK